MMLIAGTIPDNAVPLSIGPAATDGEFLIVSGQRLPRIQGTGAMISAALAVTEHLKLEPPQTLVVGDIGDGKGSLKMYRYLIDNIGELLPEVLVLHYCMPYMDLMKELCRALNKCSRKPVMIADAGAMYAAKGAGLSAEFDIMTPDFSEIAFLADPLATHPAYIGHHLFNCDFADIPQLIRAAHENKSAAGLLLVKGKTDYIAANGEVLAVVNEPDVPVLEAIGGTGDTITGLLSALVYAGLEPREAAITAARANRMAGKIAAPTPATRVSRIIDAFPAVFKEYLCQWTTICTS